MEYVLFGTSGASILTGLSQLMIRDKKPVHYFAAAAFISLACVLLYFGAVETGLITRIPFFYNMDISFSFFIAPSAYLFFMYMLSNEKRTATYYIMHFFIPASVFICFLLINTIRAFKYPGIVFSPEARLSNPVLFLFSLSGDLYLLFYNTMTLIHGIMLHKRKEIKKKAPFRIVLSVLLIYQASVLVMILNYVIRYEKIFILCSIFCGFLVLIFSMISIRMLEYKSGFNRISSYSGKKADTIWNTELETVLKRIRYVLEEKKYYTLPEYQLKTLARDVRKPVAQVSYTINRGTGESFPAYINSLRIHGVARDLVSNPEESILIIAMDNGFNSKSSFNTLFRKTFGVSPREYRSHEIHKEKESSLS